ncbi:MAG: metal ABC transporter permease [Alphaproteobacteria bacterium]
MEIFLTTIFTQHYNATIVILATFILGLSSGAVGTFLVLRKQSLISDAITHATLPGIALGFILSLSLDLNDGKYMPLLLACSAATAYLGALSVQFLTNHTRLPPDAAIATTMSFFYGLGLLLLSIIQNIPSGNKAGLGTFLLGQVAGLTHNDLILITAISLIVIILVLIQFKELRLLCFDRAYASLIGMNVNRTENLLLILVIMIICAGLKTVGLIMIIALLIIPPITARLWTSRTTYMVLLSSLIGGVSAITGVYVSSDIYDLPTGSTIVLSAFTIFIISILITAIRRKMHV